MKPNITKIAVATLSAIALTSQLAAVPQTAVKAESNFAEVVSVREAAVAQEFTQDKYTKSQVEFLISQIVAQNSNADDCGDVSYIYSDLYYSPSDKAGYVIDFTYGDSCGYIVMLVDDECSKPAEIVLDRQSPYCGKAGTYMYPSQGSYYILADNGNVVEAMQYTEMSDKPQNAVMMSNIGNFDGIIKEYNEPHYFESLVSFDQYEIYEICDYYNTDYMDEALYKRYGTAKPNNCANIAGVIALNYWNKRYDNDILKLVNNEFMNVGVLDMSYEVAYSYADKFYRYMKTNNWFNDIDTVWGSIIDTFAPNQYGGTLPANCYAGFERLLKEKGYKGHMSVLSTYDEVKENILCNIPVFISTKDYYMGRIDADLSKKQTNFNGWYRGGYAKAHTFIAYGYREEVICDKNGELINLKYLIVADGWGGTQYFIMDKSDILNAAAIYVQIATLSRC